MKMKETAPRPAPRPTVAPPRRGQLFRKYVALFVTVVCVALIANGVLDIWFSFKEQTVLLARIHQDQAEAVARVADAVVVGSALVDASAEAVAQNRDPAAFVLETAAGLAKAVRAARAVGVA